VKSPLTHLDHHFLTAHNGDASADHDGGSAASFAARRLLFGLNRLSATGLLSANVWKIERSGYGAETNRGSDKPLH
jgi:hypothetical protein